MTLVDALEAGDEFFGERFAGLGPEQAAGDAAVLLDQKGEGEQFFDVLLDVDLGFFVEGLVLERVLIGFWNPRGVEAEVDEDMAVLLVSGDVEAGAEAEDADGVGAQLPGGVGIGEGGGVKIEVGVLAWMEGVAVGGGKVQAAEGGIGFIERPELPAHLELVGHVVVELLGGFGDGGIDGGVGWIGGGVDLGGVGGRAWAGVDVDALVGGGFGEVDGVCGGCGDTFSADQGELAEHADERGGEGLQAEVWIPEAEVKAVGHDESF